VPFGVATGDAPGDDLMVRVKEAARPVTLPVSL
jgi:hypothetical protein